MMSVRVTGKPDAIPNCTGLCSFACAPACWRCRLWRVGRPFIECDTSSQEKLTKIVPVIKSSDLERSVGFYPEVLDFQRKWPGHEEQEKANGIAHLIKDGAELQLSRHAEIVCSDLSLECLWTTLTSII